MKDILRTRRRFTRDEKIKVMEKTGCRCGKCGQSLHPKEATVDHIIPLSKGGLNDEYNLIALCNNCNQDKADFLYSIEEYYKYILPEYMDIYQSYHDFAVNELYTQSLFGYDTRVYNVYPEQQRRIIENMINRRAKKAQIDKVYEQIGVKVLLKPAYLGDAEEILQLIQSSLANPNVRINSCYYDNVYQIRNDILDGEVYILKTASNDKIHGVFMFQIIYEEDVPFIQLQNILDETGFSVKYMMTAAFVDMFAMELYSEIMEFVTAAMMMRRIVPIYFETLKHSFKSQEAVITMRHRVNGVEGDVEFMTMKYLRQMAEESSEYIAKEMGYKLDDWEVDLLSELLLKYRNIEELDFENEDIRSLFKKYPSFTRLFKPSEMPLYENGFGEVAIIMEENEDASDS